MGNHRRHGTGGLYEGRGNEPTLAHGDGERVEEVEGSERKLYGVEKVQESAGGNYCMGRSNDTPFLYAVRVHTCISYCDI